MAEERLHFEINRELNNREQSKQKKHEPPFTSAPDNERKENNTRKQKEDSLSDFEQREAAKVQTEVAKNCEMKTGN
jgi:hypothetical protein